MQLNSNKTTMENDTNTQAKRDPNEVWMVIKPLLGNMIMIKKVASQF